MKTTITTLYNHIKTLSPSIRDQILELTHEHAYTTDIREILESIIPNHPFINSWMALYQTHSPYQRMTIASIVWKLHHKHSS